MHIGWYTTKQNSKQCNHQPSTYHDWLSRKAQKELVRVNLWDADFVFAAISDGTWKFCWSKSGNSSRMFRSWLTFKGKVHFTACSGPAVCCQRLWFPLPAVQQNTQAPIHSIHHNTKLVGPSWNDCGSCQWVYWWVGIWIYLYLHCHFKHPVEKLPSQFASNKLRTLKIARMSAAWQRQSLTIGWNYGKSCKQEVCLQLYKASWRNERNNPGIFRSFVINEAGLIWKKLEENRVHLQLAFAPAPLHFDKPYCMPYRPLLTSKRNHPHPASPRFSIVGCWCILPHLWSQNFHRNQATARSYRPWEYEVQHCFPRGRGYQRSSWSWVVVSHSIITNRERVCKKQHEATMFQGNANNEPCGLHDPAPIHPNFPALMLTSWDCFCAADLRRNLFTHQVTIYPFWYQDRVTKFSANCLKGAESPAINLINTW